MKLANKYASFFAGLTLAATFVGCGEPAKDEPMKPATDPMKPADTAPPAVTPGIGCTTALTSSPRSSLGTPNTAASATFGWVMSRFSHSCG